MSQVRKSSLEYGLGSTNADCGEVSLIILSKYKLFYVGFDALPQAFLSEH
jgi:hypothetical protein